MTEFTGRTLHCPVCHTGFGVEVPLGTRPIAFETDFRPVFEGPDPLAADMAACPTCRYAGYLAAFESAQPEEDEEIDRPGVPPPVRPLGLPDDDDLDDLRRWIRRGELVADTELAGREPVPAERYVLAARVRDFLTQDDPLPVADLYLRGAWCARAAGDRELEHELLEESVEWFDAALDAGKVPTREKGRTIYLTAELARRSGDFALAVDLFGQVDANVDRDDEEGLRLHRLARRMESLATMQSAVAARMPSDDDLEAFSATEEEASWRGSDDEEQS